MNSDVYIFWRHPHFPWTKHCLLITTSFRWLLGVGCDAFQKRPSNGLGYDARSDVLGKVMSVVSMILGELPHQVHSRNLPDFDYLMIILVDDKVVKDVSVGLS